MSHDLGRQGGRGQWLGSLGAGGGGSGAPKSATLTRDANGDIETVTRAGELTWTLSRNPNASVASLTNTVYLATINRDGNGVLTGITVT